jgi:hypothetical protein
MHHEKLPQYYKLYTAADSAVAVINYQPQLLFDVRNAERQK